MLAEITVVTASVHAPDQPQTHRATVDVRSPEAALKITQAMLDAAHDPVRRVIVEVQR